MLTTAKPVIDRARVAVVMDFEGVTADIRAVIDMCFDISNKADFLNAGSLGSEVQCHA
jgi:hypothetical protein